MPAEIIDLLSSPEGPPQTLNRTMKTTTIPKATLPAKSLMYQPVKRSREAWLILSSDDDSKGCQKATQRNVKPAKILQSTKPAFIGVDKTAETLNTAKGLTDFFFLSDDFDSTINLDDSTGFLPPAKKRRPSSSPVAIPPTKLAKSPGFNRSISSVETSTKARLSEANSKVLRNSRTLNTTSVLDPIAFTSSPDPFEDIRRRRDKRKQLLEQTKTHDDTGVGRKDDALKNFNLYDDYQSDGEFPDLETITSKSASRASSKKSSLSVLEQYNAEKAREKKAQEKSQLAEAKTRSKEERIAFKEAEKERKLLEKEEKAREKLRAAELAKVNVSRTNKQKSSPEMIIDLPSKLLKSETSRDSVFVEQVRTYLVPHQIQQSEWDSDERIIRWRRKICCRYNDDEGQWEPVEAHIKPENHVLYLMSADEFVELATAEEGRDIDTHVLRLKVKFASFKIIYLIEGLTTWMRKNKTIKNRQFTESVRGQKNQVTSTATQRTKKKKVEEFVDEDRVEDALLRLQVMHGVLIHHTQTMIETAEWIVVFTQHISTIPYKYVSIVVHQIGVPCIFNKRGTNTSTSDCKNKLMIQHFAWTQVRLKVGTMLPTPSSRCCRKCTTSRPPSRMESSKNIPRRRSYSRGWKSMVHLP